jgi:hypothetical protein
MERGLLGRRDMNSLSNVALLRSRPSADRVRGIVVESGASALTADSEGFDETVVVTQTAGELPAIFAQRVTARLAGVERSRRRFASLTVLTGDRSDAPAIAARRLIVLGLAAHAAAHGGSAELLLKAPPLAGPEMHAELLGLIEEVMATSPAEAVPIRLVFAARQPEPETRSGIFPAVSMPRVRRGQRVG